MTTYGEKVADYFEWNRQEIIPHLPAAADRICEIGCGAGATLANLKRRYNASFAAGFDIHEPSIVKARDRLDMAEVLDIDSSPLPEIIDNIDLFQSRRP